VSRIVQKVLALLKPCSPLWHAILFLSFLLGYFMNPIVSIFGVSHIRYVTLIGIGFSGLFFLMIFLAIPKESAKKDGHGKEGDKGHKEL
jgi:uncharacterized membrane protein YuzA (DUF378 family)